MSQPISVCSVIRAFKNPALRPALKEIFEKNLKFGSMTLMGCRCGKCKAIIESMSEAELRDAIREMPKIWEIMVKSE
jgi:hypothetical protein